MSNPINSNVNPNLMPGQSRQQNVSEHQVFMDQQSGMQLPNMHPRMNPMMPMNQQGVFPPQMGQPFAMPPNQSNEYVYSQMPNTPLQPPPYFGQEFGMNQPQNPNMMGLFIRIHPSGNEG